MQQLNWSLNNVLPSTYYDWSDCILTHENILANSDLPLSTILLVSFYHDHIVDVHFHWFSFMTKIMSFSHSYQVFMNPSFPRCRFFQLSLTSSSSRYSSSNLISLTRIIEFGVNNEYSKSSSTYVNVRLFRLTLTL